MSLSILSAILRSSSTIVVRMRSSFAFHSLSALNCRAMISDTILTKRDSMASNRFVASALSPSAFSRLWRMSSVRLRIIRSNQDFKGMTMRVTSSTSEAYTYPISGYGTDTRLIGHHLQ